MPTGKPKAGKKKVKSGSKGKGKAKGSSRPTTRMGIPRAPTGSSSLMTVPAQIGFARSTGKPRIVASSDGVCITHSELFDNVLTQPWEGAVGLSDNVDAWTIQPGFDALFPWLWNMAQKWEFYRFRKLEFEFIPKLGTSTAGTIVMSYDLDVTDPMPTPDEQGRRLMMGHEGAKQGPIWAPLSCQVLPQHLIDRAGPNGKGLYVYQPNSLDSTEPRSRDLGSLFVGVFGGPWNSGNPLNVGDLFVHYEVELRVPQMLPPQNTMGLDRPINSLDQQLLISATAGQGYTAWSGILSNCLPVPARHGTDPVATLDITSAGASLMNIIASPDGSGPCIQNTSGLHKCLRFISDLTVGTKSPGQPNSLDVKMNWYPQFLDVATGTWNRVMGVFESSPVLDWWQKTSDYYDPGAGMKIYNWRNVAVFAANLPVGLLWRLVSDTTLVDAPALSSVLIDTLPVSMFGGLTTPTRGGSQGPRTIRKEGLAHGSRDCRASCSHEAQPPSTGETPVAVEATGQQGSACTPRPAAPPGLPGATPLSKGLRK